ncbi:MAG TPA: hypothetical protein VGJ28_10875 [Micromonosporaceae bacterium]|jgi:hypothetical protein
MVGLFPGALIGAIVGFFLGVVATRRGHLGSAYATAGKNHAAAVKALAAAKKAKRGAIGSVAIAVLVVVGVMVMLGYVSFTG